MIYLNTGFFKPMFIILTVLILPITVSCLVLYILDGNVYSLIVSIFFFMLYIIMVCGVYKHSKTQKYFITIKDNFVIVNYPSFNNIDQAIAIDNIIQIEYYKLSSIKGWFMIFNCIAPQCIFMTYLIDNEKKCQHIGYVNLDTIKKLCADLGVDLLIR